MTKTVCGPEPSYAPGSLVPQSGFLIFRLA